MEMTESPLTDFIKKNLWGILTMFVLGGSFYTMVGLRLTAIEVRAQENREDIQTLTNLIERVIVLEQHDKQLVEDIREIKSDVKEILKDRGI